MKNVLDILPNALKEVNTTVAEQMVTIFRRLTMINNLCLQIGVN